MGAAAVDALASPDLVGDAMQVHRSEERDIDTWPLLTILPRAPKGSNPRHRGQDASRSDRSYTTIAPQIEPPDLVEISGHFPLIFAVVSWIAIAF